MLSLRDVTVIYPDKTKAVDGVSFTLDRGGNIALIGGNGAGKTSLLLSIVGILEPSGGAVEVNGVTLSKKTAAEIRGRVGLVFQNPDDQLFMPLIYDDVAFGCRNAGMPESEVGKHVGETLERLGIGHLRGRSPLKLSGGEKRLAAIAAVLAVEPDILMLDEPTAYLDPKAKRALAAALKTLRHPKIIATHDLAFASEVCNRVIALKDGRKAADGDISILRDEAFLRDCGL